jgi:hypothetical protein
MPTSAVTPASLIGAFCLRATIFTADRKQAA